MTKRPGLLDKAHGAVQPGRAPPACLMFLFKTSPMSFRKTRQPGHTFVEDANVGVVWRFPYFRLSTTRSTSKAKPHNRLSGELLDDSDQGSHFGDPSLCAGTRHPIKGEHLGVDTVLYMGVTIRETTKNNHLHHMGQATQGHLGAQNRNIDQPPFAKQDVRVPTPGGPPSRSFDESTPPPVAAFQQPRRARWRPGTTNRAVKNTLTWGLSQNVETPSMSSFLLVSI